MHAQGEAGASCESSSHGDGAAWERLEEAREAVRACELEEERERVMLAKQAEEEFEVFARCVRTRRRCRRCRRRLDKAGRGGAELADGVVHERFPPRGRRLDSRAKSAPAITRSLASHLSSHLWDEERRVNDAVLRFAHSNAL